MNGSTATLDTQAIDTGSVLVWSSNLPVGQIEELLARARNGSSRARALASTIDGLVVDLTAVMDRDAERAIKEERAAVLRAELEAKAAELAALEAELADELPAAAAEDEEPAAADGDSTVYEDDEADGEDDPDAAESPKATSDLLPLIAARRAESRRLQDLAYDPKVKEWAKENNFVVPERGRVGNAIVKWYLAAQEQDAGAPEVEAVVAVADVADTDAVMLDVEPMPAGADVPEFTDGFAATAQIREWLIANGYDVADRGRLSEAQRQAFYDAHRGAGA